MSLSSISISFCLVLIVAVSSCEKKEAFDPGLAASGNYTIYAIDSNGVETTIPSTLKYSVNITRNTSTSADITQTTKSTKVYSNLTLTDQGDFKVGLKLANGTDNVSGNTQDSFVIYTITNGSHIVIIKGKKF